MLLQREHIRVVQPVGALFDLHVAVEVKLLRLDGDPVADHVALDAFDDLLALFLGALLVEILIDRKDQNGAGNRLFPRCGGCDRAGCLVAECRSFIDGGLDHAQREHQQQADDEQQGAFLEERVAHRILLTDGWIDVKSVATGDGAARWRGPNGKPAAIDRRSLPAQREGNMKGV